MFKARQVYRALGLFGGATFTATTMAWRYRDRITGQDSFSQHTNQQHQKHPFSGMHEPLIPTPEQLALFKQHFSQYTHLLPTALNTFREQQALKTPVKLRPLSECPIAADLQDADILVVGGAPALMAAVSLVKTDK